MRTIIQFIGCTILAAGLSGCATNQLGPVRPITVEQDVALAKALIDDDLLRFSNADFVTEAGMRNEIVTARMYIIDVEYDYYEARLTREMQDEGLLATATELGLTTAATLVPVVQTKTLLSALATGVVGLDKAYNEKELLSNTVQALQTQMRADRKREAAVIYAKMFKDLSSNARMITPIAEYTLPMALSDVDAYYQMGTLSSALIGLSKTVATAERNADEAKSQAGPNPGAVSLAKATASPVVPPDISRRPTIIGDVRVPMQRVAPPPPPPPSPDGPTRLSKYESNLMLPGDFRLVLDALCRPKSEKDLGIAGSPARLALHKFLEDNKKTAVEVLDRNAFEDVHDLVQQKKRAC